MSLTSRLQLAQHPNDLLAQGLVEAHSVHDLCHLDAVRIAFEPMRQYVSLRLVPTCGTPENVTDLWWKVGKQRPKLPVIHCYPPLLTRRPRS